MSAEVENKVFYNKLVRDGIVAKIESAGEACSVREVTDMQEFQQELCKKVLEEASGLAKARSRAEFLSEYADLMVVLDALTATMEFSEADVQVALQENVAQKGLFKKRHFLHWSEAGTYESNETPQGIKS